MQQPRFGIPSQIMSSYRHNLAFGPQNNSYSPSSLLPTGHPRMSHGTPSPTARPQDKQYSQTTYLIPISAHRATLVAAEKLPCTSLYICQMLIMLMLINIVFILMLLLSLHKMKILYYCLCRDINK